jgi:hypothetical protein
MSNKEQFEREFESFLNEEDSRIAALYRKLPRAEPDAKLDAAVLAMARRAVATTPRPRVRAPRWVPALSAAAVVALAAGIAFRVGPQVWQEHAAPSAQNPAAGNAPAPAATNVETMQPVATDALKDKAASKPAPVSEPVARAVPPPPAAPPATAGPVKPQAALRKMEAAKRTDAPTPQAFPTQAAPEQKAAESVPGDAGQARNRGELREKKADLERDEMQTAPLAPPAPAAAAPAREELAAPRAQAAGSAEGSTRPAPAAAKTLQAPRSNDPNARLYPEHWLANIRVMLRENRHDDALRSLAEFRRMYPEYHLPDDLRDLRTPE